MLPSPPTKKLEIDFKHADYYAKCFDLLIDLPVTDITPAVAIHVIVLNASHDGAARRLSVTSVGLGVMDELVRHLY